MKWKHKVCGRWEKWFAWYPINVRHGKCHHKAWLETVERSAVFYDGYSPFYRWEYRNV